MLKGLGWPPGEHCWGDLHSRGDRLAAAGMVRHSRKLLKGRKEPLIQMHCKMQLPRPDPGAQMWGPEREPAITLNSIPGPLGALI